MNNETQQLKWPEGAFTHTEFATLNNRTNQQVWSVWSESRKNGILIPAGERKTAGKGKPSLLFSVNPNPPTDATVPTLKPVSVPKTKVKPVKVVDVAIPTTVVVPTPAVEIPMETVVVATVDGNVNPTPETVTALVETEIVPEVIKNASDYKVDETTIKVNGTLVFTPRFAENERHVCPVCKNPLIVGDTDGGTLMWCNKPIEVCKSPENPFGRGKNQTVAFETLCAKFAREAVTV